MSTPSRQLAAIMFTDIAGYTALMQADEDKAAKIRGRHREVFKSQHNRHHGEIIQYFGDGTLSIFKSAIEAVNCAIDIQIQLKESDPVVPVRIGIHTGDIVYSKTEVYGDGVNLASRVESVGVPGAILLSGKLHDELKNQSQITTLSLGIFEFKNVTEPVEVFCISNEGITIPDVSEVKGKLKEPLKSIAVLPLTNMSSSEENEYFSDGMTEEIINALTKVKGLKVTSRTSSFYFKNKKIPLSEIGKELNVSTILEGSVRLAGNQMRITVQLVDVMEDFHFWSETFDRSVKDVFAVQDEVSLLIAEKLREHLGYLDIQEHLVEDPVVPVDVYKQYLKSRYHLLKMSKTEIEKGLKILKEIVKAQPNYPYAHLGMHMAYTLLGSLGFMPVGEAFVQGKTYLDRAIELDENIPECQLQLSWVSFLDKWDLDGAYKHLNKVLEIRPIVDYYQSMASILIAEGKFQAAWHFIETASQLDPMSEINYHLRGFILYCQERYEEAINYYKKSLEIKPDSEVSIPELGQALLMMNKKQEALEYFSNLSNDKDEFIRFGGITLSHAALGHEDQTKSGMKRLEQTLQSDNSYRALILLVYIYVVRGNQDKALDFIEHGIEQRFPLLVYLGADPILKPLRSNPRFISLVSKVLGESTRFMGRQKI